MRLGSIERGRMLLQRRLLRFRLAQELLAPLRVADMLADAVEDPAAAFLGVEFLV